MPDHRTRVCTVTLLAGVALSLGCGSSPPVVDAIRTQRGPVVLDIDGDPNGLFWDGSAQRLYVADNTGNRILAWTDERGFSTFAELPDAPSEGAGLGQLVRAADGSLVVTRFGFGTQGGVAVVHAPGNVEPVPGLDVTRRRIGLTRAADGSLYDTWFVKEPSGVRSGAVGQLSLDGQELALFTGVSKPVGVLALGERLFVSDQERGQILVASRAEPSSFAPFASLEQPDLLAAGPDGSLFAGSAAGSVYRVDADGTVSALQTGLRKVRGVAYDAGERRLFVAEHDPEAPDAAGGPSGGRHALHIFPVD